MQNIIIATLKEWNILNYFTLKKKYEKQYNFYLISNKEEFTYKYIKKIAPKYIFFPHWSWIIPKEIYNNYECVVFHMTDLPYGRGGSPLQNLISNGIYDTKITALKVTDGLDSGDIYIKTDFNISTGSAQDIFTKASDIIFKTIIPKFFTSNLSPIKQVGKIVNFKRRVPQESNLSTLKDTNLLKVYDFIRMLDADSYPKAYTNIKNIKIIYTDVKNLNSKLSGKFEIIEDKEPIENIYDKWNSLKQKIEHKNPILFNERDILFLSLGQNIGYEQYGKGDEFLRPVVVIKKFNKNIFLGIPLSSKLKNGFFFHTLSFKGRLNSALLLQSRTFDSKRIKYKLATLSHKEYNKLVKKYIESVTPSKEMESD